MNERAHRDRFLPPLWVLTLLAAALCVWLLLELREMVTLLVVGYFLAYIINPLLRQLEKRNISRPIGVFVIGGLASIIIALLFVTVIPTLVRELYSLAENLPSYIDLAKEKLGPLVEQVKDKIPLLGSKSGESPGEVSSNRLAALNGEAVQKILQGLGAALLQGYNITLTLVNLLLLPFIVFYLAIDFHGLHRRALLILPKAYRSGAVQIFLDIDKYVSAFVHAQFIVATILFALYAVGLGFIGVELWFVLALIAGYGNVVPYLGSLVGIVLTSVMTLVTFGDLYHLLMVWGVFAVVQFLEGSIISPRVVGNTVGISPLVVILAIFAGGQLFGLLGIFLAVPGAAVLMVLGNRLHRQVLSNV